MEAVVLGVVISGREPVFEISSSVLSEIGSALLTASVRQARRMM